MKWKELLPRERMLYPFYLVLWFVLKAYGWWSNVSSPEALPLDAPLAQREAVRRGQLTSKVLLILLAGASFEITPLFLMSPPVTIGVYISMMAFLLLAAPLNRRGKSTLAGFIVMMNVEFTLVWFILPVAGVLDVSTLPMLDFLVIPTLLAVSLHPPKSVFPIALANILFILASVLFLPKTAALQAWLSSASQAIFSIPLLLEIIISAISYLWVRGSMNALKESTRADLLDHLYHEQSRVAETDAVTGLPNHRAIMSHLQETLVHCEQTQETCALLFMDLDHFKQINDTWGHLAGDLVLREAVKRLQDTLAAYGKVGRYGGEEFAVVLHGLNFSHVYQLAEQTRAAIADAPCLWQPEGKSKEREIMITASIGIALCGLHGSTGGALIESADKAMYQAKSQGRNCVRIAENTISDTYTMQLNREQAKEEFSHLSMSV